MRAKLPALIILTLLSGCAITAEQLLKNPAGKVTFETDWGYQHVHRIVYERSLNCVNHLSMGSEIYTDIKSSKVTALLGQKGFEGAAASWIVEIREVAPNRSAVDVYYAYHWQAPLAAGVSDWVHGRSSSCPATTTPTQPA